MIPGMPETLRQLAQDRRFTSTPALAIWIAAAEQLDYVDARELKATVIERAVGVSISTATKYLERLAEDGYLIRDLRKGPNDVYRYRVPASRVKRPRRVT